MLCLDVYRNFQYCTNLSKTAIYDINFFFDQLQICTKNLLAHGMKKNHTTPYLFSSNLAFFVLGCNSRDGDRLALFTKAAVCSIFSGEASCGAVKSVPPSAVAVEAAAQLSCFLMHSGQRQVDSCSTRTVSSSLRPRHRGWYHCGQKSQPRGTGVIKAENSH
jgi:hypothetical protein